MIDYQKQILRRVLDRIEQDYTRFNMAWWHNKITAKFKRLMPTEYEKFSCGTVGCFAGHVIIEVLGPKALEGMNRTNVSLIPDTAQAILGLSQEQAGELFHMRKSVHYAAARELSAGTKKYAKAVTNGIRTYLRGQGVEL